MYSIRFFYNDGSYQDYKGITSVIYSSLDKKITVTGEDLLGHAFPLNRNLQLLGNGSNYSVSCTNLKSIHITK